MCGCSIRGVYRKGSAPLSADGVAGVLPLPPVSSSEEPLPSSGVDGVLDEDGCCCSGPLLTVMVMFVPGRALPVGL